MNLPFRVRLGIFIVFVILVFGGSGYFISLYTNWLWFGEVGFQTIFTTLLWTKIGFSALLFCLFFLIVWGNIKLANRSFPQNMEWYDENSVFLKETHIPTEKIKRILLYVTLFVSFLTGTGGLSRWQEVLYFLHGGTFGIQDPIFHRDIGFYTFQMPFYEFISDWFFTAIIFSFIAVLIIYFINHAISFLRGKFSINPRTIQHLSVLLAVLALLKGFQYWLATFDLLYSTRSSALYGATYTDIHAQLLAYHVLMVITVLVAVMLLVNMRLRKIRTVVVSLILWIAVSFLLGTIYPEIVQKFSVTPNEFTREKPYIANNIQFTNAAYGMDKIKELDFPVAESLNREVINRNAPTIRNIRLWDHRPLLSTYKQIQVIRQYYDFHDVDIDRYHIGNEYVQTMLSAREISSPPSPSWINDHLVFTHGYGLVATRVNEVAPEGLPTLLVKDIPPVSPVGMKIDRPEIYFGETQKDYILVKAREKELDYPKGNDNVYTIYQGTAGIPLNSYFRKLMFSYLFGSSDLLFTNQLTADSRIVYRRSITERVQTIMPFLTYDPDPYIVISGGKLYWILDGYTQSDRYPYSQPYRDDFNYIRNSVKVVVDAYNGTVWFYVIDPSDPIIQTWMKIFPDAFKPIDQMPPDLKSHIRYPEKLFRVQSEMYGIYHMKDPQVFYNQEDKWTIPSEIFESQEKQPIEPYYIIMRLPGESKEEFMLMVPFSPATKSNMIAWMSADCDAADYGRLIVYKFPKEKQVYGPSQIEARIDQNTEISSQLTLWNQKGSSVIRGNLLVIPIEDSIMYIEPLYLKAEQSQIPEFKRVIIAYGDRISMEPTLEDALTSVFGGEATPVPESLKTETTVPPAPLNQSMRDLIHQAGQQFDNAQEKLKSGDWAGYGTEMQKLRDTLKQLKQQEK